VKARELFQSGELDGAIASLSDELRADPTDAQRRTFLFELLGFAGEFDRAEKQLDILAQASPDAAMGALLYRSALHAEKNRREMFLEGSYPKGDSPPVTGGTLNGERFTSLVDGDSRIGARFEVFAAGEYMWLPLEHIASITIPPPQKVRDLLWAPGLIRTGPGFEGLELGEVLIPALAPLTFRHPDDAVRLGRVTEWQELDDGGEAPIGQKLLLVDDTEFPILELRELIIDPPAANTG